MRILFVVDGRSPIALNWMQYFIDQGHEVHLVTTFACQPAAGAQSQEIIPVAFSSAKGAAPGLLPDEKGFALKSLWRLAWGAGGVKARTLLRQWLGTLTLPAAASRLAAAIQRIQPDVLHAMRIPFEGMMAAAALERLRRANLAKPPLIVSVWGNDFTLHAGSTPLMAAMTRKTLRMVDGLHTDCRRDQRIASRWGFPEGKPALAIPGNGGIRLDVFSPGEPSRSPLVVNPRGVRAYVRNDAFFKAIPLVLEAAPEARFIGVGMQSDPHIQRWVDQLGIAGAVELLPAQSQAQMADVFRRAQAAVSPTTHDGTPNTLLEAMACGCFPIAGDLESLREWISPGVNGLLCDPADSLALAKAIIAALTEPELRRRAAEYNRALIAERADYARTMPQAESFYRKVAVR